jgi:hypothetical protein
VQTVLGPSRRHPAQRPQRRPDPALRSFAAFLAEQSLVTTSLTGVARRHVEDYKPWLACRPAQNKPRLAPAAIAARLGKPPEGASPRPPHSRSSLELVQRGIRESTTMSDPVPGSLGVARRSSAMSVGSVAPCGEVARVQIEFDSYRFADAKHRRRVAQTPVVSLPIPGAR